jgi:hypothetical protein
MQEHCRSVSVRARAGIDDVLIIGQARGNRSPKRPDRESGGTVVPVNWIAASVNPLFAQIRLVGAYQRARANLRVY